MEESMSPVSSHAATLYSRVELDLKGFSLQKVTEGKSTLSCGCTELEKKYFIRLYCQEQSSFSITHSIMGVNFFMPNGLKFIKIAWNINQIRYKTYILVFGTSLLLRSLPNCCLLVLKNCCCVILQKKILLPVNLFSGF